MSYKDLLFTFTAWRLWAVHTVLVSGVLFITFAAWIQFSHAELVIQIPSVERVFKK